MLTRLSQQRVSTLLRRNPAVVLLGPRQVGKTTLAKAIMAERAAIYLDLESPRDLARLTDPLLYLEGHADKLVVLDEVQRAPELFGVLRGLIDTGRERGHGNGRFLLLGSASLELLKQSSESLAGRLATVELTGLLPTEVSSTATPLETLWTRGGFPRSVLADSDDESFEWRTAFLRTYLERDIPSLGPRIPAETLRRLWTMLAHSQGGLVNASTLAAGLGISGQTVTRYIDLLVDLLLVRRLPPWLANAGKRLVRSPKVYVRDSGLVHALLGITDRESLLSHPVAGPSWEGFAIEALLAALPPSAEASFYRTSAGAELDLVVKDARGVTAIEVKRASAPRPTIGFHHARLDVQASRAFVVYAGDERYPLAPGVEAIGLRELMSELAGST